MGEIGRDRRDYLYEMEYWEILLIIRGYRRRNVLLYQLQRLTAYGAFHAMSGDKQHKGPDGWLPLYFDKYRQEERQDVSDEDVDDMLEMMKEMNGN